MAGPSSADTARHSLEELLCLYELEPLLRDVYVEGPSDAGVICSLFAEFGLTGINVRPIESVNIPETELRSRAFRPPNRRGEVITLALFLAERLPFGSTCVTCLVDLDLDGSFNRVLSCSLLMYTDFSCIESYVFEEVTFAKLLRLCGYKDESHYDNIFRSFAEIMSERYCQRIANERLGLGLKKLPLRKFLIANGSRVHFNSAEYVRRMLDKSAQAASLRPFIDAVEEARRELPTDPRYYTHGHDLGELLGWLFRETRSVDAKSIDEVVAKTTYCVMEFHKLGQIGVFRRLIDRLSTRPVRASS